eukprot:CAMPEP_0172659340 /NCGR_PEP_ID=MMETSP1074-20121228/3375_1 /TAXON_ID=2916 /ORGANISM="Ceratium fusus, Strain PA161109" /LENGTH=581 /DNA_ID=CAMNT_0013474811 /DNA_START=85 /DNA_END=1831 /DNA_ORIENTATION=+
MPETMITDVRIPLPWEDASAHVDLVKEKAARQFAAIWKRHKDREEKELFWGEEIEYYLLDLEGGTAQVALEAHEVLRRLGPESGEGGSATQAGWRTEYGDMMVEGVTMPPFSWSLEEVLQSEPALAWRRREVERIAAEVKPGLRVVTLSAFPLLGTPSCTSPIMEPAPDGFVSQSILCPDGATSPHPRYQVFTANYRKRKGCKVGAFIPREGIKADQQLTSESIAQLPFELAQRGQRERDPVPGHIYMDSQAFGACQCCTQATFLARNLEDARHLTDQFLVLSPLLLALTAATPFLRGLVADTDTRWQTFQQTWDDRTQAELTTICNSRCSPCDLFIGAGLNADDATKCALNDVEVPVHTPALQLLEEAGVDAVLARHVAHLLARDPMMVFKDRLDVDDEQEADHWEQLQGTNWCSVRFKPPPCASNSADRSLGWRVEFRSPEVQITDFENAAIVSVIRLLAEVIIDEKWDLTNPSHVAMQTTRRVLRGRQQRAAIFGSVKRHPQQVRLSSAASKTSLPGLTAYLLVVVPGWINAVHQVVAQQRLRHGSTATCRFLSAVPVESFLRLHPFFGDVCKRILAM